MNKDIGAFRHGGGIQVQSWRKVKKLEFHEEVQEATHFSTSSELKFEMCTSLRFSSR